MTATGTTTRDPDGILGRDHERELVGRLLDALGSTGGALMLVGDPGVGKTFLLEATLGAARARGVRCLSASGVEFEAGVGYAGLHQLLLPLTRDVERLPLPLRSALRVALGLGPGPAPERAVVGEATLHLLSAAGAERPTLLVLDDVHWLDRSSLAVLDAVARDLPSAGVGLLAASRPGDVSLDAARVPRHELPPLGAEAAERLLRRRFPGLAPAVRHRILAAAQGNPLALVELPAELDAPQRAARSPLPAVLPLGPRLREAFAARVADLPPAARATVLLAALEAGGSLQVVRRAARGDTAGLALASRAGLLSLDERADRISFRHPLVRAAVVTASTLDERRRAHAALAAALVRSPERRAWHLARAAVEPDAEVADLLDALAHRVLRRGDAVGAVAALARAADLSPHRSDRSRRLQEAAYVGLLLAGDVRSVADLLAEARRTHPASSGSLYAAIAVAYQLLNGEGDVDTAHRLLVGALEARRDQPLDEALVQALNTLCTLAFHGARSELWEPAEVALHRLGAEVPPTLRLMADLLGDPARTGAAALDRLDAAVAALGPATDPLDVVRISSAAIFADRLAGCRPALRRIVEASRRGPLGAQTVNACMFLAHDAVDRGAWDEARDLVARGLALCDEQGYHFVRLGLQHALARIAAIHGNGTACERVCDEVVEWWAPRGGTMALHCAHQARALAAAGAGDYETAYRNATAVSPPGVLPPHVPHALWVGFDLVEAALHTGRRREAVAHVEVLQALDVDRLSPRLALLTSAAAAMVATDDVESLRSFEKAQAVDGAHRWPFDHARVQLAHGERLRRARAVAEAREQLAAALATFERLGARPWAERAANELRAAGHDTGERAGRAATPLSLTPQEREIAELAARGMTNKQIAARLLISPRTVATHLYKVFPKVGVTSRAGLRDALEGRRGSTSLLP